MKRRAMSIMSDAEILARQKSRYRGPKTLLDRGERELRSLCQELGLSAFRGRQIHDALWHGKGAKTVDEIRLLPKLDRQLLREAGFETGRSQLLERRQAEDGTVKLLLKLHDGYTVETVAIPTEDRLTVCVSSQVGCKMACDFCATGKNGYARNLMPHEILDQVAHVQEEMGRKMTHCVYMGMGEPLANLPAVLNSIEHLGTFISGRRITVSTVGLPGAIRALADKMSPPVTLAVSLHAPSQELRAQLVPSAAALPLANLMDDAAYFFSKTKRRISFEYCLLADVNDQPTHAYELARLLTDRARYPYHVNLLPWNPIPNVNYQTPSRNAVRIFAETLRSRGVGVTIRSTRGLDADAACGQLATANQSRPEQKLVEQMD